MLYDPKDHYTPEETSTEFKKKQKRFWMISFGGSNHDEVVKVCLVDILYQVFFRRFLVMVEKRIINECYY